MDSTSFVAKLDAGGNALWAVKLGGGGDRNALAIATHADGSSVVTGIFYGTGSFGAAGSLASAGKQDVFVAKLAAADGGVAWAVAFGGADADNVYAIDTDADGSSVLTGDFQSASLHFGSGVANLTNGHPLHNSAIFVARLSPSGTTLWAKAFGNAVDPNLLNAPGGRGHAIAARCDGGIAFGGYGSSGNRWPLNTGSATALKQGGFLVDFGSTVPAPTPPAPPAPTPSPPTPPAGCPGGILNATATNAIICVLFVLCCVFFALWRRALRRAMGPALKSGVGGVEMGRVPKHHL